MVCASCKTLYMLSHTQPCHDLGTEMICVYRGEGWWVFDIGGRGGGVRAKRESSEFRPPVVHGLKRLPFSVYNV